MSLTEYKYTPSQVSYTIPKTEEVYTGIGVVYDTPQTDYGIKAIIGSVMFIDVSGYQNYQTIEFNEFFGNPALYFNGIKCNLTKTADTLVTGAIQLSFDPNTSTTEKSYTIFADSEYMQHSVQFLLPSTSKTDFTRDVVSTLNIPQISRKKDYLNFKIETYEGEVGTSYEGPPGITGPGSSIIYQISTDIYNSIFNNISVSGDFAYVNIQGSLNSVDDWYSVPLYKGLFGNENSLDISLLEDKESFGAITTVRFFTNPVDIFGSTITAKISPFNQTNSVYSKF
jgi:hypothetical protein